MINEIKVELSKMHSWYQETHAKLLFFTQDNKNENLMELSGQMVLLIKNLTEASVSLDTEKTSGLLDSVLTSIDNNLKKISGFEKNTKQEELFIFLEKTREMHCIQWDYFETFEELIQSEMPLQ